MTMISHPQVATVISKCLTILSSIIDVMDQFHFFSLGIIFLKQMAPYSWIQNPIPLKCHGIILVKNNGSDDRQSCLLLSPIVKMFHKKKFIPLWFVWSVQCQPRISLLSRINFEIARKTVIAYLSVVFYL